MKALCIALLLAAAAAAPSPALAGSFPPVMYNDDNGNGNGNGNGGDVEQGSEELSTDGPPGECAPGYVQVEGLCVPHSIAND